MRREYPSYISREQFEHIRVSLESINKVTKPRKIDIYDAFCAVLYILTTGCQWRSLPSDFPKWQVVYVYFRKWTKISNEDGKSLFEKIQKELVKLSRKNLDKQENQSVLIIDRTYAKVRFVLRLLE